MGSRVVVSTVLLVILLSAFSAAIQAHGSPQPFPLELGYGLTTLTPVSSGIPVYTVRDTLWALSKFNETVSIVLVPPNSGATEGRILETGMPVPVHKFSPSDNEGTWSLRLFFNNQQKFMIPVHFIKGDDHRPMLTSSLYHLQDEGVITRFDITSVDVYDEEACLTTKQTEDLAVIHLPQSIGVGDIGIRKMENNLILSTNASFNSPLTFWLELYHPFSFNVNGTTEFISRNMRTATSTPILISSRGESNASLDWETAPRLGRYEARAFFQSSSGLYVVQVRILVPDQESWLSMDSCQLTRVNSSSISFLTSLRGNPSTWPTRLYLMYRVFGVESTSLVSLNLKLSKITLVAEPWQVPVDDLRVRLEPNLSLDQYTSVGGTIYVLARSYPMHLNFSVAIGSHFVGAGVVDFSMPYTVKRASLSVGKLSVHILNQETPSAGVVVKVSDSYNETILKATNTNAYATFFVPAGTYNVTASLEGQSRTVQVTVSDGSETDLNIELPTTTPALPEAPASLQGILVVTGAIGVVVNVFVWVVRPRLSR
ncbi:MAG: carboxypeptidase regulatory-like domain-containing protein [Thaumarchaeota archaeon]|nr:carboxypeptidase regulatory-like domain-containing protein [Nitrososphaerota archaeon]